MNITEANNINVLLHWLLETTAADDNVPTHDQARDAATYLADRANGAIRAGWNGAKVRNAWSWHDDTTDTAPTAELDQLMAAAESHLLTEVCETFRGLTIAERVMVPPPLRRLLHTLVSWDDSRPRP